MSKIIISGMLNDKEENYIKIKINNINSKDYIETLSNIFDDLEIDHPFEEDICYLSKKYKEWIGSHHYLKTKDYIIHMIFAKNYLHLIIKCSLNKRNKLIETIKKYGKWIVVKPKINRKNK